MPIDIVVHNVHDHPQGPTAAFEAIQFAAGNNGFYMRLPYGHPKEQFVDDVCDVFRAIAGAKQPGFTATLVIPAKLYASPLLDQVLSTISQKASGRLQGRLVVLHFGSQPQSASDMQGFHEGQAPYKRNAYETEFEMKTGLRIVSVPGLPEAPRSEANDMHAAIEDDEQDWQSTHQDIRQRH